MFSAGARVRPRRRAGQLVFGGALGFVLGAGLGALVFGGALGFVFGAGLVLGGGGGSLRVGGRDEVRGLGYSAYVVLGQ
ncbi:MAG: hypothetical protein IPG17_21120 [Sandaracinaceae bacterium]|nr:hypothetical protein [Sandaracinaceae bacterium]